jgi:DNA topoisomerase-3
MSKGLDPVEVITARKVGKPEKLLNITGPQKKTLKLHGYTPEKTLEIAQALYEKYKCLFYPRAPSRVMEDGNWDLFREKFKLFSARYPGYAQYRDESLITPENRNIFNFAALGVITSLSPRPPAR